MLRPRGFADLADLTVGIWGVGREGTAALNRIRDVAAVVHLVDDTPDPSRGVIATDAGGLDLLSASDVVLKSPGISKRRPEMSTLSASNVCVTSALNLWMWEADRSHVVAVTGTKGKSTTTALIAFFLRSMGEDAQSAGNIGQPPYEPTWRQPTWTVLEVSSFQAADIEVAPALVVVTSLGADHLDWHGSVEQYWSEKLALTRAVGAHRTVLANDATLIAQRSQIGGDTEVVGVTGDDVALAAELSLIGRHNASNVAVAVRAATAVHSGDVRAAAREYRGDFAPLPGRLTLIRDVDHVRFVDDGLATSVTPTLAALDVFRDDPLALIAGGFDRGVDYTELAASLGQREAATTVITTGPAGGRIAAALRAHPTVRTEAASHLRDAVSKARAALTGPGVVLLSPAAPSFDAYENWEARSADFARIVREI